MGKRSNNIMTSLDGIRRSHTKSMTVGRPMRTGVIEGSNFSPNPERQATASMLSLSIMKAINFSSLNPLNHRKRVVSKTNNRHCVN